MSTEPKAFPFGGGRRKAVRQSQDDLVRVGPLDGQQNDDPPEAEASCRKAGMEWEWRGKDRLRGPRQIVVAMAELYTAPTSAA